MMETRDDEVECEYQVEGAIDWIEIKGPQVPAGELKGSSMELMRENHEPPVLIHLAWWWCLCEALTALGNTPWTRHDPSELTSHFEWAFANGTCNETENAKREKERNEGYGAGNLYHDSGIDFIESQQQAKSNGGKQLDPCHHESPDAIVFLNSPHNLTDWSLNFGQSPFHWFLINHGLDFGALIINGGAHDEEIADGDESDNEPLESDRWNGGKPNQVKPIHGCSSLRRTEENANKEGAHREKNGVQANEGTFGGVSKESMKIDLVDAGGELSEEQWVPFGWSPTKADAKETGIEASHWDGDRDHIASFSQKASQLSRQFPLVNGWVRFEESNAESRKKPKHETKDGKER